MRRANELPENVPARLEATGGNLALGKEGEAGDRSHRRCAGDRPTATGPCLITPQAIRLSEFPAGSVEPRPSPGPGHKMQGTERGVREPTEKSRRPK